MLKVTLFIIITSSAGSLLDPEESLVWSVCTDTSCKCGDDFKQTVLCEDKSELLWIQPCSCLYFDSHTNKTILGSCFITCLYHDLSSTGSMYYPISRYPLENGSLINDEVCNAIPGFSRTGRFCGKCKEDYGLSVYSYDITNCIPCKSHSFFNWLAFFAASLLPLTVFYFIVLILGISVTSSHFNGLVFVIQSLTLPYLQRALIGGLQTDVKNSYDYKQQLVFKSEVTAYGIFNLDFFRAFFPNVCLSPDFNFMHIASLELVIALYPFALIMLTYILVTMYDKNFHLIVWLWKPFRRLLRRYHQNFQVRTSLIEVFATFILLTNIKLLEICSDHLISTTAYAADGRVYKRLLYYYPSIEYFSLQHVPFVVTAIITGTIFVVIPFLFLLIYPCQFFQKLLTSLKLQSHLLQAFMDAFQGSYRTEPRDMRYFSAYYFFLRIVFVFLLTAVQSVYYLLPVLTTIIIIGAAVFAYFQPYQNAQHNKSDIVFMFLLAFVLATYTGLLLTSVIGKYYLKQAQILVVISTTLILITYFVVVLSRLNVFAVLKRHLFPKLKQLYHYFTKSDRSQLSSGTSLQVATLTNISEHTPLKPALL